jgi:Tol biopolymer transport system component
MTDLRDRFHALDDLPAPDLWREIESQAATVPQRSARGLPWVLVMAVLLLGLALGGAALIGSGIVQLPSMRDRSATHLAYGLDGDIYLADRDGRNPVRIADGILDPGGGPGGCGSFWGEGPMWSPDGRHFAYRSAWDNSCRGTTGEGKVYISDAAGHIVTSFPGTGWLVSWSPDSNRVATWVDLAKTIGIYGLDGARQALLTMPPGCALPGDFDPVWSPDGRSLVVWPCEVPIDGSTPRPFPVNDPRSHEQFAYSPDGARVAYVAAESLVIAAADGSQDRVLVPTGVTSGGLQPVWSPTGDRIAFDTGPLLSPPVEIRIVDVASGKATLLAGVRGDGPSHVLSFSPEGDRVLFWQADASNVTSLWSVRTDGSDARLLVTGTGWGDWQPLSAGS